MELGSIIGIISGIVFMFLAMLFNSDFNVANVRYAFIDFPSMMITFGGTIAAILISYPIGQITGALKAVKQIFNPPKNDPQSAIREIIELANLARREGILALEERASSMEDEFLKKGIMLIVDGTDPELVRSILETEMAYIETRHGVIRGVWADIAALAPAWGMIGTLTGLVLMLLDMNVDTLGPKMSVALITTFYGSVIANFIATPVSNKLKYFSNDEMVLKEVLIEGMLSIQAGENPRIIEEKLKSFLAPSMRDEIAVKSGGEA